MILQINCLNLGNELRKQGRFGFDLEMYLNKKVSVSL